MSRSARLIFLFIMAIPVFTKGQHFDPKTLIPAKLSKYKFGMTLEAFKALNKTTVEDASDGMDHRIQLIDRKAGTEFESVTYHFDAKNNKPLYEIIIDYATDQDIDKYVTAKLKVPNHKSYWKWTTKEGVICRTWVFGRKLILALALPSTPWYGTND